MYSTNPINGVAQSPASPQRQLPEKAKPAKAQAPEVAAETNNPAVTVDVQHISTPTQNGQEAESAAYPENAAERIHEMVEQVNQRASAVKFEIEHDENNELIVKIVNKTSGDVVREIPPEEIRKMSDQLNELRGILFKEIS